MEPMSVNFTGEQASVIRKLAGVYETTPNTAIMTAVNAALKNEDEDEDEDAAPKKGKK